MNREQLKIKATLCGNTYNNELISSYAPDHWYTLSEYLLPNQFKIGQIYFFANEMYVAVEKPPDTRATADYYFKKLENPTFFRIMSV